MPWCANAGIKSQVKSQVQSQGKTLMDTAGSPFWSKPYLVEHDFERTEFGRIPFRSSLDFGRTLLWYSRPLEELNLVEHDFGRTLLWYSRPLEELNLVEHDFGRT
jgi:hypothetical protein